MQILPEDTLTTITTQLTGFVSANALVIVGVIGTAVGIGFVMRWFNKSTKKVKA